MDLSTRGTCKRWTSGDGPQVTQAVRDAATGPLLDWYRASRRDLPWRRRQHDPYAVWVSEIMLQQTQVATVVPYYERWMERFPTIQDVANAPLEEVLRCWAGLGYYARARNLHRAAAVVLERHGGVVPCDDCLVELPGVGRYTQGAIRSIAFGLPEPIVDANVARVLCRVFALDGDPKSAPVQSHLWRLAGEIVPEEAPGEFNQAVMELGATICAPAEPACERCPLLSVCRAGNSQDPTTWPQTPSGRTTVRLTHVSAVVPLEDRFLVVQRPPHGLWGGLWEFPRRICEPGESPDVCAVRAVREIVGLEGRVRGKLGTIRHCVTHHAITLHAFILEAATDWPQPAAEAETRWATSDELASLPFSAPQARLVESLHHYIVRDQSNQGALSLFDQVIRA